VPLAAVVFDLYGTLLDIGTMRSHVSSAGIDAPDAFLAEWRRTQLEYAFLTSMAAAYRDFDALTALALERTCAVRGVDVNASLRAALVDCWRAMPPYPDVRDALEALRALGVPRAVLTNGTPASADAALAAAGVRDAFDAVLCVDAVRAYKPDRRVYALATTHFACGPRDVAFVSSNAWDVWGASAFGFRVAWCNRHGGVPEALAPRAEATIAGLHELEAFVATLR